MANKRGRPIGSKNKLPEAPLLPRNMEVWDMRAAFGGPKLLAKHPRVRRISDDDLLESFGIGKHLRAVLIEGNEVRIIQAGSN